MTTSAFLDDKHSSGDASVSNLLDGLTSESDLARSFGESRRTWQRRRRIRCAPPYIRVGRCVFYRLSGVRDWLLENERLEKPTPTAVTRRRIMGGRKSTGGRRVA
jgi:hypothetical protein